MQTINISKIFILPTEPDTKVIDRFWYNPTNRILSRYTGSEWEPISVSPDDIDVNVNSQTMSLAEYIDAVTEGLLEVSSQIESISTNKANLSALDTKQDKLNYYNEGDNVANITSETTNTNNIVAKNITLGGYERAVEGGSPAIKHGVAISDQGILKVEYNDVAHGNIGTTTIEGDVVTFKYDSSEDNKHTSGSINSKGVLYSNGSIQSGVSLTGARFVSVNDLFSNSTLEDNPIICDSSVGLPYLDSLVLNGSNDGFNDGLAALMFSERGMLRGVNSSTYNNDTGEEDILFHAGSRAKINIEAQEASQENCIFGSLVDKELSEESLETHIPTSSAVVSYVDNQTTPIKEDIVDIQQTKANNGEFYFEGGALTTTNKMPLNTPFSCIWTMAMTREEFKKHKTDFPKIIGNLGYWTDTGYGWCINRLGTAVIGVGANNVGGSGKHKDLVVGKYLDGNPHIWSVVYNGTNISLYIDNVKKTSLAFTFESSEATNPLGIGSTPTSATQDYGVWGKIYRIKYFNFDMSTDDAPYTIADYISGKDESPLLQGSQPVFDWKRVPTTATLVGNKLSFETSTTSQSYVYPLGETTQLKKGKTYILKGISNVRSAFYSDKATDANSCKVSWQTINKTTSVVETGSDTKFYVIKPSFVNGEDVEFTIVFTPLVDDMIIYTYFPVGTIGYLEFYSAEQVRALLSLDDYSIEDKVLDISGNNNHATITGSVYGSKSGSVEKFVETVIGDVHEIVDDLRDEVNLLSQQITISTHTSTFTSSSTDITNIYEDDTKAALPGRIMIQPKLSNVAPMYFGENVSDKTKAFPLYPDQITDFYFEDINNFKVASDAVGDGCNFVIEWGVTNVVADIASAFTMYDDSGNKYKISIVDGNLTTTLI